MRPIRAKKEATQWRHCGENIIYSFRRLSRSPGLVCAVVLSVGLGIAANSTIFSMVSRFVLRPAPVGNPGTLMALHTTYDGDRCCNSFPFPVYTDVRDPDPLVLRRRCFLRAFTSVDWW